MKIYSKIATILVASVLAFSLFGCKQPSSNVDANGSKTEVTEEGKTEEESKKEEQKESTEKTQE